MINPIILNKNGVSRFTDFVSIFPPILRQEPDVVEFLNLMSDYINNAYRDTQSVKKYSMQMVTTEAQLVRSKKELERLRELFISAYDGGEPILYITDSDVDPINPFYTNKNIKMRLVEDSSNISFVYPSDTSKDINIGDVVIGDDIPENTIVIEKSGNIITLNNLVDSSGEDFISFVNSDNDFDDVISFNITKVGDIQDIPLRRDVEEGIKYIKIYFNVEIKNIVGDIENIDLRYNLTGYSNFEVENLDNVIQAGNIKFRSEKGLPISISNISHSLYINGTVTPNNFLPIDNSSLFDIENGYKVVSDNLPGNTFVTSVTTDGVYLSNNILINGISNVTFYPTHYISPLENSVSILPSAGQGRYIREFYLTESSILSATQYNYDIDSINDNSNIISINNYSGLYDNGQLKFSEDLSAVYFSGETVNILLTRANGSKNIITKKIDSISYDGSDTIINFSDNFLVDILDSDTIEIINKFSKFYSISDIVDISGVSYSIQKIIEYDISGAIIDESLAEDTPVVNTEIQLGSDINTSGVLSVHNYKLIIQSFVNNKIGDYVQVRTDSVPDNLNIELLNSDQSNSLLVIFNSENNNMSPYRFEFTGENSPWKWIDSNSGYFSNEYVHSVPNAPVDMVLSNDDARENDQIIIHTDMSRSININVPSSDVNIVSNSIDIKRELFENNIIEFVGNEILPSPLSSGVEYYIVNPTGTNVQLSSTKSGSVINLTSTGSNDHPIQIKNEIQYLDADGTKLLTIKSLDKRKSYKNIFTFNGTVWSLSNDKQTFRDGSGIFYSRQMTNKNVPEKYLNANGDPIFKDSIHYVTEENWKNDFLLSRSYTSGDIVGSPNGNMYVAINDVNSANIKPENDDDNWKLIDTSIYVESDIFGKNPYTYGPLDTKTISGTDIIKSNYLLSLDETGKIVTISGDVRNLIQAGESVNISYYQKGNLIKENYLVNRVIYYANNSTTEVSIFSANDYSEIVSDVDISDNTIEVSDNDVWRYGQRVTISSNNTLPSPLESDSAYYIISSKSKSGDPTKKLLTISSEFGNENEVDISSIGSGIITITSETVIPPDATSAYLELDEISNIFFMSKENEHVFNISTKQRSWLFNPSSASESSYTRNGWLTTINNDFTTTTEEFYCRRNLFNTEEVELGYYVDGDGFSQPAWYRYIIDELENITYTDYASNGAGYDIKLEYVDNTTFNKIRVLSDDVNNKYTSDRSAVSNFVKVQIDGSEIKHYPILSIDKSSTGTYVEFGNSDLSPVDINTTDNTINVSDDIADGTQVSFYGSSLPSPIVQGEIYYVINSNSGIIKISNTVSGSEINITGVGSGKFTCKYNIVEPEIINISTTLGSKKFSVNGIVDLSLYSAGDYILAKDPILGNIFPSDTSISSIDPSSGIITVNKSALTSITSDISILSSNIGKMYYVDKTYMRIKQLRIDTDISKIGDESLEDNEKYAIYANLENETDVPGNVYTMPKDPLILVSGVADDQNGIYADYDVVHPSSEELIESFFEFEHIDNIDTTNYPSLEYDYRRDDNTHILAKDVNGEYIHKNVNIDTSFSGIADQKYSFADKIERLAYLKDPNVIDIDLIEYLARFMGYDITVLKDDLDSSPLYSTDADREMALRKTIQNLPEYHRIKSTTTGLQALLLTFGVVGKIIKLWTVKSDPYLGRWFSDDEIPFFIRDRVGGNKVLDPTIKKANGGPSEIIPTPHFKLTVDVEPEDESIAPTNVDLSRVKLAITRNKPINTVFDGIVSQLKMAHSEMISRPAMKNKVKLSMSVGFDDDNEFNSVIGTFNECDCP